MLYLTRVRTYMKVPGIRTNESKLCITTEVLYRAFLFLKANDSRDFPCYFDL